MADTLDPATMDALNQLGEEIEAQAGAAAAAEPPAEPAAQDDAPPIEDAANEPLEARDEAAEAGAEGEGDDKAKPKRVQKDKDVQRLLRERYEARNKQAEAEARATEFQRQLDELKAQQRQPDPQATPPTGQTQQPPVIQRVNETGQDFEARVQAEAARRSSLAAFNEACDRVAAKGAEVHKDFAEAQGALVGAFGRQMNMRPEFLQAITRLENGHDVFHHLGTNLEAAEKLFSHSDPVGLVMAMGDLSAKLKTPKVQKVSNAPAPVTPIRGGGNNRPAVRLDDDKADVADWSKQFLKEMAS